jgi:hypothetical protein
MLISSPRVLAAFGQGNVQRRRRRDGVVKEQFVKVAHAIEQQRIGVLRFDAQVLRHHGRDGVGQGMLRLRVGAKVMKAARRGKAPLGGGTRQCDGGGKSGGAMAVYCFGSINIDHFYTLSHLPAAGETLAAQAYRTELGGKGANQSVAAVRAGAVVLSYRGGRG